MTLFSLVMCCLKQFPVFVLPNVPLMIVWFGLEVRSKCNTHTHTHMEILVRWPSSSSLLKKKKREKEEGPVLSMGRLFIRRLLAAHDYGCFYTFNVVCLLDFMVRHKLIFGRSVSTDGINNALMRCILRWSDRTDADVGILITIIIAFNVGCVSECEKVTKTRLSGP